MATAARIEANRQNACKRTGPKTKRGKARVGLNANEHGARSRVSREGLPSFRDTMRNSGVP
jgi:hypothetical protein